MARSEEERRRDTSKAAESVTIIVLSVLGLISLMSLLLVDPYSHGWGRDFVLFVESGVPTAVMMLWPVLSCVYWTTLGPMGGLSFEVSLMSPACGVALAFVYYGAVYQTFPTIFLAFLSAHFSFHLELFTLWGTKLFDRMVAKVVERGETKIE